MKLHHRVSGRPDAPTIVLSGSLGSTTAMWEPQLRALAGRFRVVRYDHPGHGGSPLPDRPLSLEDLGRGVLDLLDTLGVERTAFCGLSLGGIVGMWLGSRASERLTRLALCCSRARFAPAAHWEERATIARRDGLEALADAALERWFTARFRETSPHVVEQYRRMLVSIPAEGYARCCEVLRDADVRAELGSISVPTLVLSGASDPAVTPEDIRELADGIPDAYTVELRDAAHLANVEQPEAFTDALLEHLGATAAA
jgi:3-oxoadipate enol-lactonase